MKLGLDYLPDIIEDSNDLEIKSLIFNKIQEGKLTPIEVAKAYKVLIDLLGLTQEGLAQRLGSTQPTIANKLRMLTLPDSVQQALQDKKIHGRHARALLALPSEELQQMLLYEIIQKKLNIRETDQRIQETIVNSEGRRKPELLSFAKKCRIALKTIRETIQIIQTNGINIKVFEKENNDELTIIIKIPKKWK